MSRTRRLLLLTPDQLNLDYLAFAAIDPNRDLVVQIEAREDFTHVPSHRQRIVLFLSAMRHFSAELTALGYRHSYSSLDDPAHAGSLEDELTRLAREHRPDTLVFIRPGDWRSLDTVCWVARETATSLELLEDPHFLSTPLDFSDWAASRKQLVLEHFYRWMRKRKRILVNSKGEPSGGQWNFDKQNRRAFGKDAPDPPDILGFEPDEITHDVVEQVRREFPESPGSLDDFFWPVTRQQALAWLEDFIARRLPHFGSYQDAMVKGQFSMFHSLLSPALNLKLLDPRECLTAAVDAFQSGHAPINAVEGFVRQILGWREFIRGVYWHEGPDYGERNYLGDKGKLPSFYWDGETEMVCVEDSLESVRRHGFSHHIQRLMVTGNLALLAGVEPRQVSNWYLAMYVDSMDWVTLPNTAGMVMFADGGVVGSKPYAATGKYLQRMSNYCGECTYDPAQRSGPEACPFTTLYWDFLLRQRARLASVPRMQPMWRNLDRLNPVELRRIARDAERLRKAWGVS